MSEWAVVLIVAVIVGAVVLIIATRGTSSASASFSLGKLFQAEVKVGPQEQREALESLRQAHRSRELDPPDDAEEVVAAAAPHRLTRLLWVDDHPDNNVHETVMLERLGFVVTTATSTAGALRYLQELPFALAVTDLKRGEELDAGFAFAARARAIRPDLPVVAYTADASGVPADAATGAVAAIVDTPAALLRAVRAAIS